MKILFRFQNKFNGRFYNVKYIGKHILVLLDDQIFMVLSVSSKLCVCVFVCLSVCICMHMHVFSVVPDSCGEMGELTFVHILTGWIPDIRTIK